MEHFLTTLVPVLQTDDEMRVLHEAVNMWNGPGRTLFVPMPALPVPGPGEAHVQEAVARQRRVHCADIQLTFNHDFLGGQDVSRLTMTRVSVVVLCLVPRIRQEHSACIFPGPSVVGLCGAAVGAELFDVGDRDVSYPLFREGDPYKPHSGGIHFLPTT